MSGNKGIKNRTGFLFMFIILFVLGLIMLIYRDKFSVLYKYGYNNARNFIDKKIAGNKNLINQKEKINKIVKKENDKIRDKIKGGVDDIREKVNDKIAEKTNQVLDRDKNKNEPENEKNDFKKENSKLTVDQNSKEKSIAHEDNKAKTVKKITSEKKTIHSLKSNIYFSKVTGDEKIKIVSVKRNINYSDAPLTETLKILFNGPTSSEKSSDILSNIPPNTRLLSVKVKDDTAYINLSVEFEFNPYGKEAAYAQVKQIVYTTTEFSNIKYVQFLIDGKIKTYLGGEGIVIDKPLTRNDFS
jgi:germination protein M